MTREEIIQQIMLAQAGENPPELRTHAEFLGSGMTSGEIDTIVEDVTKRRRITMRSDEMVVSNDAFEPWVHQRRAGEAMPQWGAYRTLLAQRGRSVTELKAIDKQTDEIVERVGDPKEVGSWQRRGLVIGEVQSGKTATYIGVLNKALDFGYKAIVVIGGHTEDLRRQTQSRLDVDLVGVDSKKFSDAYASKVAGRVGVGKFRSVDLQTPISLTTVDHDFRASSISQFVTTLDGGAAPVVFVVKKNASVLSTVAKFLSLHGVDGRLDEPILVVDDECDWGSPNTNDEDDDPTAVNAAIRKILYTSRRSSYMAITATPFANVFIDHAGTHRIDVALGSLEDPEFADLDDLFPKDYVRTLTPPNAYLGVSRYFPPRRSESSVDDAAEVSEEWRKSVIQTGVSDMIGMLPIRHKKTHRVPYLPTSLESAISHFLAASSVRRLRSDAAQDPREPAAMLINVSRFKDVQANVGDLVTDHVEALQADISNARQCSELPSALLEWMDLLAPEVAGSVAFVSTLRDVAAACKVRVVNGDTVDAYRAEQAAMTPDERELDSLRPTIFVGGDVLSRGITIDGLVTSYFVREPRSMDTLLQMGRWFGYRNGYADLVRIWMPEFTRRSFIAAGETVRELVGLVGQMRSEGLTPREFGLRVAVHPDTVAIVAANKARGATTVPIPAPVWENRLLECVTLSSVEKDIRRNRDAVSELVDALGVSAAVGFGAGGMAWNGVPGSSVRDFLGQFQGRADDLNWGSSSGSGSQIRDNLARVKGAERWTVAIMSGRGDKSIIPLAGRPDHKVASSVRNGTRLVDDGRAYELASGRLSSANDVARISFLQRFGSMPKGEDLGTQAEALESLMHPIIFVYLVTGKKSSPEIDSEVEIRATAPLVTVSIAFPKMTPDEFEAVIRIPKEYMVNSVWLAKRDRDLADAEGDDQYPDET